MSPIPADRRGPGSRLPPTPAAHSGTRAAPARWGATSPRPNMATQGTAEAGREAANREPQTPAAALGRPRRGGAEQHRPLPRGQPPLLRLPEASPSPRGSDGPVPPPLSLRASLPPPSRRRRRLRSRARLAAARGAAGRDHGGRRGPHRHLRRCGRGIQPGTRGRRGRRGPSPPFPSLARLRRRAACRALSAAAAPLTPPLFGRLRRRAFPPPHAARGTGRASGPSPPAGPLGERRPAAACEGRRAGSERGRGAPGRAAALPPSLLSSSSARAAAVPDPAPAAARGRPQRTGPCRMRSGEQLLPGGRGEIQPLFANGGKKPPSRSGFSVDLCGGGGTSAALFLHRWRNYLPFIFIYL